MSAVVIGGHRGNGETDRESLSEQDKNKTPENTLASLKEAVEQSKAALIEIDVMLSADKIPVVTHTNKLSAHVHPDDLKKIAADKPFVSQYTAGELKQFRMGRRTEQEEGEERIPALQEVLAYLKEHPSVKLNIEIKGTQGTEDVNPPELVERIKEVIEAEKFPHQQIIFSSFAKSEIANAKRLMPDVPRAMLFTSPADSDLDDPVFPSNPQDASMYERFTPDRAKALHEELGLSYMHPEMTEVTPEAVAATASLQSPEGHKVGINVWSLGEPQPAERKETIQKIVQDCATEEVPLGFITNYVSQMRQVVRGNPHHSVFK